MSIPSNEPPIFFGEPGGADSGTFDFTNPFRVPAVTITQPSTSTLTTNKPFSKITLIPFKFKDAANNETGVVSFRVVSFRVVSFRVVSFDILTFRVITFRVIIFRIIFAFEVITPKDVTLKVITPKDVTLKVVIFRIIVILEVVAFL
jgi:hypothetical protein